MAKPVLIDLEEMPGNTPAQTPSDAPPVPDIGLPDGRAVTAAAAVAMARPLACPALCFGLWVLWSAS